MIYKFYSAQKYLPSEGDWILQVKKDLTDLRLELIKSEIRLMSHYQFKKIIRNKIQELVRA